eukprot:scaffold1328_cov394-Prasinococcus_capsulatus_cf.AAC.52
MPRICMSPTSPEITSTPAVLFGSACAARSWPQQRQPSNSPHPTATARPPPAALSARTRLA